MIQDSFLLSRPKKSLGFHPVKAVLFMFVGDVVKKNFVQ